MAALVEVVLSVSKSESMFAESECAVLSSKSQQYFIWPVRQPNEIFEQAGTGECAGRKCAAPFWIFLCPPNNVVALNADSTRFERVLDPIERNGQHNAEGIAEIALQSVEYL